MYIGIDLGTSGVKAILLSEQGDVLATQTEKLQVSRPHPLWSEQDPEQWWQATDRAMKALGEQHSLRDVKALGIAGQMHGATLLDSEHRVLRPAILWNDGRCAEECALLEDAYPLPGDHRQPDDAGLYRAKTCCGCSATNRRFSVRWRKSCCRKIICVFA
jgi:xylulokinase